MINNNIIVLQRREGGAVWQYALMHAHMVAHFTDSNRIVPSCCTYTSIPLAPVKQDGFGFRGCTDDVHTKLGELGLCELLKRELQ